MAMSGTNGWKPIYPQPEYTTFVALVEDHLDTVKELERYKTKLELLHTYLKYRFVDDDLIRIIAGDLE